MFECKIGRETLYFSIENAGDDLKVTSVVRRVADDSFMVGSLSDHARIMLGSFSDWSRILHDVSAVFDKIWSNLG